MQENNLPLAKMFLQKAVMLNPDHVQTLINLAVVYHQTGADILIKPLLFHALKLEPANAQVKAMLGDLK
jgi:Tfp pilus assembly protein PilF